VVLLTFPIGIVYALCITAIAAWPLSTTQALVPTIQLRALVIVCASATNREDREHGSENSERCVPKMEGGDPIQIKNSRIAGARARIESDGVVTGQPWMRYVRTPVPIVHAST
jgi:hypothetical protein